MQNPDNILEKVKELRIKYEIELKNNKKEEVQRKLYNENCDFADKNPALFNLVFNSNQTWKDDLNRLENMVNMVSNINEKKISRDKASELIGGELVDTYVKPKLKSKKL